MLKKAIVLLAMVASAALTYGQGTVNFNTLTLGTTAQIKNVDGTLAAGTGFFAQLYAAKGINAAESSLLPVGDPVNLRTGGNAGYVQTSGTTSLGTAVNSTVTIAAAAPGGPVTLQLRAWAGPSSSYAAAVAAKTANGKSALFNLNTTGDPTAAPPTTPVNLVGLAGFQLVGTTVPEPSTIALGLIGAGALLIRRRK